MKRYEVDRQLEPRTKICIIEISLEEKEGKRDYRKDT